LSCSGVAGKRLRIASSALSTSSLVTGVIHSHNDTAAMAQAGRHRKGRFGRLRFGPSPVCESFS